jgi:phosphate transport system substrate-binding protein
MRQQIRWLGRAGAVALVGLLAAAAWTTAGFAGLEALKGRITADGSSTVGPFTTAAAEMFQRKNRGVQVTVGISGTGGGFERFCNNETDLSNASRPIKASEHEKCLGNGVRWLAMTVANDGIALVVNKSNTWASCLTVAELKKIWDTGSKVDNWRDVRAGFPNVPLKLFGAGTDSGTFDFFTEAINGKSRRSRSDYTASENDNILVRGVEGERGALGYFGLSYYQENKGQLKLLSIDGGSGCVAPNIASVQSKRYKPLSRPLFIYAKRASFHRAEVRAFLGFVLNNQKAIAARARFVPLTAQQARGQRVRYLQALKTVR